MHFPTTKITEIKILNINIPKSHLLNILLCNVMFSTISNSPEEIPHNCNRTNMYKLQENTRKSLPNL